LPCPPPEGREPDPPGALISASRPPDERARATPRAAPPEETALKTILLADDEENLRLLLRATLEEPDYVILEAADGPTAHEFALKHRPDLIILDWMMPGMSGLELTRLLRADPITRDTPIILLTARGQDQDCQQARHRVQAYLVKPFSPLEVLEKVEEILG
jgi:two-component system phosphate regulon response regulator PhoB